MRTVARPGRSAAIAVALIALAIVAVVGVSLGSAATSPAASPDASLAALGATLAPPTSPTTAPPTSGLSSAGPSESAGPSASLPSGDVPSPSTTPTPYPGPLVATRVVVPDLGIDLAITKSPPAGAYPYCNVAMYFGKPFGQPGQSRATYLFAHARVGMFYPIYELTMVKRTPNAMVGMLVDVYTSDSRLHVYQISKVLPHQLTLNRAAAVTHDELWLQTSEGPHGTPGKTQVVAEPVSVASTDYAASHPEAHIVRCGY